MRLSTLAEDTEEGAAVNNETWRIIAAQASTIDERLSGSFVPSPTPSSAKRAEKRLRKWRDVAAAGTPESFAARLKWDGLDEASVLPWLGDVSLRKDADLPRWAECAAWCVEAMRCGVDQKDVPGLRFLNAAAPIPFEDLLGPIVLEASSRLTACCLAAAPHVVSTAWASLERDLLVRLSELVAPTLFERFDAYRFVRMQHAFGMQIRKDPDSTGCYRAFVDEMRAGGLDRLMLSRPVLARLIGTATDHWIMATAILLNHLVADLPAVSKEFGWQAELSLRVTDIKPSGADLHSGGRSVIFLSLANCKKLVYKPRSLEVDVAWAELIAWLELHGAPLSAAAPKVLSLGDHGWAAFIEPREAADDAEASEFFKRAGAALCLFHAFQGWDMHFENVIARGSEPVAVDLETLFHPWPPMPERELGPAQVYHKAAEQIYSSVLACGYLPSWVVARPGYLLGVGGLSPETIARVKRHRFININADAMQVAEVLERPQSSPHLPRLKNRQLAVSDYVEETLAGYREMHEFLTEHRDAVRGPNGPLSKFAGKLGRIIMRPTQLYVLILKRSLESGNLESGVDWSLHWDFLARFSDFDEGEDYLRLLMRAERASFSNLDIPLFHFRNDRPRLDLESSGHLDRFFSMTSLAQVRDRLDTMNDADRARQLETIRQALESTTEIGLSEPPRTPGAPSGEPPPLSKDDAVSWAQHIGTLLTEAAIQEQGGAAWLGVVPLPGEERAQLEVIGHDLYAGSTGVALFLAALARVTNDSAAETVAHAAIAPLLVDLQDPIRLRRLSRRLGIGGMSGLGSIVYSLVQISRLLDNPTLLEAAATIAAEIDDERIARDQALDVLSGSAGAILGLLTLYSELPEPEMLRRAEACGRSLLSKALPAENGAVSWRNAQRQILTGFSHGTAGIAYALARLSERTENPEFLDHSRRAMQFERNLFLPDKQNWPDLRVPPGRDGVPVCLNRWCHGAPGIALGRASSLAIFRDPEIDAEIAAGVATTEADLDAPLDDLCCGNFGRIEALHTIGLARGDIALITRIKRKAKGLLNRAEQRGQLAWNSGRDVHNPGFFVGLSGVGYTLLRLVDPTLLPCPLTLSSAACQCRQPALVSL